MQDVSAAPVISVHNLTKRYGSYVAVADISFEVQRGEIFGIVGPNGAGKTSAVESLMGLRWPFAGEVRVLGLDPHQQRKQLAERIGIQLQEAELPHRLKVWELLDLFASFYQKSVPYAPLLETWGIWEKRNNRFEELSGGQKQRLFIALALINDPELVFLDELTTGLDPQARRQTWALVRQIRGQGKTVVLVTHSMEEAQTLCDRVAIIDGGKIVALDSPANLLKLIDGERGVVFDDQPQVEVAALRALPAVTRVLQENGTVQVFGEAANLVSSVVLLLESRHIPIHNLRTLQPDLEDVFIALTGKALRD
jgi:ABC-2 type transport system ATP-binding protein